MKNGFFCQASLDDAGRRIDRVIRKFLSDCSLSIIYSAFRKGLIKVNGKKTKNDYKVEQGDSIWIHNSLSHNHETPKQDSIKATKEALKTLSDSSKDSYDKLYFTNKVKSITVYKSKDIICVNKPSGIACHGGEGIKKEKTLSYWVEEAFKEELCNTSLSFVPGPLHRIDRLTSGLVIFSQSLKGAKVISENIKLHTIKKLYLAVAKGQLKKETWEDRLTKEENVKEVKSVSNGKIAKTQVTPLFYNPNTDESLVCFEIETGRTHQIRVQSKLHGHALSYDPIYDKAHCSKNTTDKHPFFLHAWKLEFPNRLEIEHPKTIIAPLPDNFKEYCKKHFPMLLLHNLNN